jgi:DNA polymerase III delta prime subunit
MAKLAGQFFKRVETILAAENVPYDKATVAEIIQKFFPDWRRVLNELQRYSATGKIDSGILANLKQTSIRELIAFMKDKNFTEVRKWTKNNIDTDVNMLYNEFYDTASDFFAPRSIPLLVTLIAKYQYQNAFSANPEINFVAFLAEVMIEAEFV